MNDNSFFAFIIGLIFGGFLFVTIAMNFTEYTISYKQGQIDAINGKIQFQLKDNPDGTREWVKK